MIAVICCRRPLWLVDPFLLLSSLSALRRFPLLDRIHRDWLVSMQTVKGLVESDLLGEGKVRVGK